MHSKVILFLMILISTSGWGKTYNLKSGTFDISAPKDWQETVDYFGIPLTFYGPMKGKDIRPVIQIIPTKAPLVKFSDEELKQFSQEYQTRKKAWLKKKKSAELLSFLPGSIAEISKGQKAFVAGATYRISTYSMTEKSYYVNCSKNLYMFKVMIPAEDRDRLIEAENILRTFRCGK